MQNVPAMNVKNGKILVVNNTEDMLFALKLLPKPHVETVNTTTNPNHIPDLLGKTEYDVILLDMNFTPRMPLVGRKCSPAVAYH
ncbi:MAG: hypothetical protein RBR30_12180 [Tenuifilaceae bacterium]|nr:hypothetical protein [Tenuifilaceae bacterium]